jgi:putative transposase
MGELRLVGAVRRAGPPQQPVEAKQYPSVRYTERLDEAEVLRSVGSDGDSYDNAAAERLNGLCKTEHIPRRDPWRGLDDVGLATLEHVDWFNHRRLHSHCRDIPPVEFEDSYYRQTAGLTEDQPAGPSLH